MISDLHLRDRTAWAAGIIDGEGYIGAAHYKPKNRTATRYIPVLSLEMTDGKTVHRVARILGATVSRRWRNNPKHKATFRMELTARKAGVALLILEPFLFTKKTQAKVLQKLIVVKSKSVPYHQNDTKQQVRLYKRLRSLNRKGPKV